MVTIQLKKFTNPTQISNMTFENVSQAAKALGVSSQTIAKSERGMMSRYDSFSQGNGYAFNGYYEGSRYICETVSGSLHYSISYSVKKNKKNKGEYHSGVALRTGEDVTSFSNVGRGIKLIPCTLKDANTGLDHPFDALVDATSRVYAINNSAKKMNEGDGYAARLQFADFYGKIKNRARYARNTGKNEVKIDDRFTIQF